MSSWIGTCTMPSRSYSTGSSTVMIFTSGSLASASIAYRVVVLPEPVGPVTSTIPCGRRVRARSVASVSPSIPSAVRSRLTALRSRIRSTAPSPAWLGSVATRRSTGRPSMESSMRPSCGRRISVMSRFAITLMREIRGTHRCRGGLSTS